MKYISVVKHTAMGISAGLLLTACATMDRDEASYSSYDSSYDSGYTMNGNVREASGSQSSSDWQQGSQYSRTQASSTQSTQRSTSQATQMEGDQWVIPLHEEQVNVGKRSVESGQVTIRKIVTTETINQPIELRRETLVIDREGSSGNIARGAGTTSSRSSTSASSQEFSEPSGAERSSTTTQQSSSQYQSSSQGFSSSDAQPFQEQTFTIRLREEQPVVEKNVVQTGRVVARKSSETDRQNIQRQVRREDVQLDRSGSAQNVRIHGNFQGSTSQGEAAGAQRDSTIQSSQQTEQQRSLQYQQDTTIDRGAIQPGRDKNTLDDINRGSNTRGGAEDLQDFDEKAPK